MQFPKSENVQDDETAKLALSVQESTAFPTGALSQWRHHMNIGSQWSPQLEALTEP